MAIVAKLARHFRRKDLRRSLVEASRRPAWEPAGPEGRGDGPRSR